jgi:hypothetical protein
LDLAFALNLKSRGIDISIFGVRDESATGWRLDDYGRAPQPTRAQQQCAEPEEQTLDRTKIGSPAAGALQDQELLLQEDILSQHGADSARAQKNGQSGKQMHQQYNRISHRPAA